MEKYPSVPVNTINAVFQLIHSISLNVTILHTIHNPDGPDNQCFFAHIY
ncbi:MAG: hypothetical protein AAFQ94_01015 [Bacteroidota bacterium]